jgi:hypothetical protein
MEVHGIMGNKISTCLYIDRDTLETARQAGLNVSKVAENSLIEAIRRLTDPKPETSLSSQPKHDVEGRGRDLNPGARLHRPIGYQATSPRPLFCLGLSLNMFSFPIYVFQSMNSERDLSLRKKSLFRTMH